MDKIYFDRNDLPHLGVYVRLKPSPIHGVGVFAIRKIPEGTYPFENEKSGLIWIKKNDIVNLSKELLNLYKDFCIIRNNGELFGGPRNFNNLTSAWYVNHSSTPNLGCDDKYNFYALRTILIDEELTVDYRKFSE